jgi:hypothetical protein
MSIEGGNFRCDPTGFKATTVKKWNEHAQECGLHTESGETVCISCGRGIAYKHLPFRPLAPDGSKNIQLQCEDCMSAAMGSFKEAKAAMKDDEDDNKRRSKK